MEIDATDIQTINTDTSDSECLVCLQPCDEMSVDLFLYTCSCVYPVHHACFKEWRTVAKNDRICMICREELDYNSSEVEDTPILRQRLLDHRIRSIEEEIELIEQGCMSRCRRITNKIIWFVCLTILIAILLEAIRPKRTRLMPSSPPQASSS